MKTVDEIYQEMTSKYADITGVAVRDGCDMAVRFFAAAAQIESLYVYNDWVQKQCFPQSATGNYLDYHAQMCGLQRIMAHESTGSITFYAQTPASWELWIPVGTVCVTASGARFETTQIGSIPVGSTSCVCQARSIDLGTACNADADTIVYMPQPPVGVSSCTNVSPFTGGLDDEDDESLRSRILSSYSAVSNFASADYYEQKALSVDGVAAVKVLPKNRGVGTVDVIVASEDGLPSSDLVDCVSSTLNDAREICVDVSVYPPTTVEVDVQVKIDIANGYSFNAVAENVKSAIRAFFDGALLGCDVLKAKLGCIIFGVEGVKNYELILPTEDIIISAGQLPTLGTLSVCSWS